MAIKIDLYSLEIPVEIGGLSFCTTMDDDSLQNMYDVVYGVYDEMKDQEEDNLDYIKQQLSKAYNTILGEDAFEMIYEKTPSTMALATALLELAKGLEREYRCQKARLVNNKPKGKKKKYVQPDK